MQNPLVVAGGIVGGIVLGFIYVYVLVYMPFLVSGPGYKYVGPWAFFLNGTASAFLVALVVGIPLGALLPRLAVPLAVLASAIAVIFLIYFGPPWTISSELWWIPVTDALQLPLLFLLGAWFGSVLRVPLHART
jgi:hypothetical protein